MRRFIFVVVSLIFVSFQLSADEKSDIVKKNAVGIIIKQKYISNGCKEKPLLDSIIYSFSMDSTTYMESKLCGNTISGITYDGENFFTPQSEKICKLHLTSIVKGRTNREKQTMDFNLKLGWSHGSIGDSKFHKKNWYNIFGDTHHDTYLFEASVLCDLPIPLIIEDKNNVKYFNIDTCAALKLTLGEYYDKGDARIRYRINGDSVWYNCYKKIKIAPKKNIELKYQDIVGLDGTENFKKGIGKFITIRVEKQLQDGSGYWTYSEDVECCFYSTGPKFDIVKVHRGSCDTKPIKIKIYTEDIDAFNTFIGGEAFKWIITLGKSEEDFANGNNCYAFDLNSYEKVDGEENEYFINGNCGNSGIDLYSFLNDNNNAGYIYGLLELSSTDKLSNFISNKKQFVIPQKSDTVIAKQVISEIDKDPTDPKIYLNIIDKDYRFDYQIYSIKEKNYTISENDNPICRITKYKSGVKDGINLKTLFNEEYPDLSFEISRTDYLKKHFHEWYIRQNLLIRSTIIVDKNDTEKIEYDANWENNVLTNTLRLENDNYTYLCRLDKNNSTVIGRYIMVCGEIGNFIDCNDTHYDRNEEYKLVINNNSLCIEKRQNSIFPTLGRIDEFIGKGNGYYLLREVKGGGSGTHTIIDNYFRKVRDISNSKLSNYNNCYVVSKDFIVLTQNNNFASVCYNNEILSTYIDQNGNLPNTYSFQVSTSGYFYTMGNEKYFRSFTPYSEDELYNSLNNYNTAIIGYDVNIDSIWNVFVVQRNEKWYEFLEKQREGTYEVSNIPKEDLLSLSNTKTGEKAYSGYIKIKDNDGCLSDKIEYVYKYYDLSYNVNVIKYPTSFTSNDGSVRLTNIQGSLSPYKYKGKDINGLVISGLKYGKNAISIYGKNEILIARDIFIPIPFSYEVIQPKCSTECGILTIDKNSEVRSPNKIVIRNEQNSLYKEVNNPTIFPLAIRLANAGNYNIGIEYLDAPNNVRSLFLGKININYDSAFSISIDRDKIKNATFIDGNGSIKIKANNASKEITWQNGGEYFNNLIWNGNKCVVNLPANSYSNIIAAHNGCQYPLSPIVITAPVITALNHCDNMGENEYGNTDFVISYDENTSTATISVELRGEGNIDAFSLHLLDNSYYSEKNIIRDINGEKIISSTTRARTEKINTIFKYDLNTKYYLYAIYKAKNENHNSIICLTPNGIEPLTLGECDANPSNDNLNRCYDSPAKINLFGNCSFTINGEKIDNNLTSKTIYTKEIKNSVVMTKSQLQKFNSFLLLQTAKRTKNIVIEEIEPPLIVLNSRMVSCRNKNDGEISIKSASNIKSSLDDLRLQIFGCDKLKVLDSLHANENDEYYEVLIHDGNCVYSQNINIEAPEAKLAIVIVEKEDPSCTNDDGSVTIAPLGGWGHYIFSIDKEKEYPKEIELFENDETYISDSSIHRSYTFSKLKQGDHTIYIYDNNGCVETKKIHLNNYINPSISFASTDTTSCYEFNDGSINGIEIKTNEIFNGTKVLPRRLFYSFKSANEELYSSVDSVAIDTINKIDGLSAGLYKLWVEDDNGCLTNEDERYSVVVHQPNPINLSFSSDTIKIKEKGNLGQVKVRVDGGNNGYKYVIVHTDTIGVVTGEEYILNSKFLNVGNHIIKASDKNNCQSNEKNITLIEPQKPLEVSIETTDAECHAKTGSAKIIISGGWKGKNGYNVQLIGKSVNMTHSDDEIVYKSLYAGKYELVVTDDMGVVLRNDVEINAPDTLVISKEVTPTYCDANSGSVSITIDGGTPQYRTFIYGAIDTIDAPNVSFNNLSCLRVDGYKVKTIDEKGCTSVATFAIPDSSLAVKITDNYFGGSATMIATISGGNANGTYQYEWKYGLDNKLSDCNSNSLTTNKSGVYYFKVTNEYTLNNENILCSTGYIPHSLIIDGDRKMKIVEIQRETGEDRRDGRVKLYTDKTNFVSLKLYSSDNVVVNVKPIFDANGYIVIDSLSGGYHSVEGILENGKRRMVDFYIQPYKKMVGFAVVTRNVQKPKGNDGEILVNVSNGIAPYNISITSNDNFNIKNYHTTENRLQLNNISAGIYNAIVMDSVGNQLELGSLHIIEPDSLSVYYQSTPANCYGDSNATVTLYAEGGWKDYQFADSKNKKFGHSNIFSGLNAGQHLFYVMDSYGTIDSIATIVNQPDILKASINSIDSVKCYGNSDGSVSFNINGGSPKYKTKIFSSDNFSDISEETIFNKLSSKNYIATFTDSHGCSSKDTLKFFIPQPDTFMIANSLAINTTCELDNGKISIEMKGGTLPYNYKWTENGIEYNKATTIEKVKSEAINLKQNGLYHVKIVDYHGCTAEYEKRIEHSENPQILDITTDDVLCYGDSSGIAIVDSSQIKLGFPPVPYHLIWPQGQENVMTVNTLSSGTHIVKITDDNNCSTTKEFFIGTPKPIKNHLLGIRNALCYDYNDGRIETFTTGGVGSYNYIWNNGEQTSFVSNLKAGTYKLVVSDEHECKDSATFEITEPEKLHVELGDDVVICPGNVHVFDAGNFTTYSWKKEETGEVIESKRFFTISEEGNYSIIVTDSIGCFAYDTVNLSIGNNALIANFLVASDAVVNDTITLVELSNMPIDSLCWEYNEESFRDITPFDVEDYICNLLAEDTGRFYITLRAYSGGCEATEQKQIDIHKIATDNYDFKMGYNPMIKSVKISPNPNNGEFELNVLLREEVDINVIINDVNTGRQVECFVLSGSDNYNHKLNIKQLNSGIFVLSVLAENERKAVKVLFAK